MTPPKNWIPSPDEFATIVDAETGRQVADFGSPFISEEESLRNFKLALTAPKLLTKLQAVAELRRRWRSQHDSETIDSIAYRDGLDELDIDAAIAEVTFGFPEPRLPIVIEVRGGVVQDVLNVPAGIEYEIRDYDSLEAEGREGSMTDAIDVHAMPACRRQIAIVWSIEDVQSVRPGLTDDQCWEVLQAVDRDHDATIGISWDVLKSQADNLFGSAPEEEEAE